MSQYVKIPVLKGSGIVLKQKQQRRKKRTSFGIVTIIIALFSFMLTFVWLKVSVNKKLRELRALQVKLQHTQAQNEKLRAEVERLASFGRIQKIAKTELGMVFLPREHIVEVTE